MPRRAPRHALTTPRCPRYRSPMSCGTTLSESTTRLLLRWFEASRVTGRSLVVMLPFETIGEIKGCLHYDKVMGYGLWMYSDPPSNSPWARVAESPVAIVLGDGDHGSIRVTSATRDNMPHPNGTSLPLTP